VHITQVVLQLCVVGRTPLAWLYLHPGREYTATELATRFGIALTTVLREANRLVEAGLIRDRTVGRARATDHRAVSFTSEGVRVQAEGAVQATIDLHALKSSLSARQASGARL
jgi:DNA-binding MarR family transcriptional regulator